MSKTLAFLLILLQLTIFSAFAEDPSDTFDDDIFDFDDPVNLVLDEIKTLHKPSLAPSPHHHHHSPSPAPFPHHHHHHSPSHAPFPHYQSHAPSPHHHHSPSHAPSPHRQSPPPSHHSPSTAPSPHHKSPAPSPNHHHHSPSPSPSPHHHSPAPSPHHQPRAPSSHHHHHSPSHAPSPHHHSLAPSPRHQSPAPSPRHHIPSSAHSPTLVPAKPPTHRHPPAHSPSPLRHTPIPKSVMVVQGVVFVKSCKYTGVDNLTGATPLLGAVVKLQCNNTKYKLDDTDKDGRFSLVGPKNITTHTAKQCNIVLVGAPHELKPSNLHDGITGAILKPKRRFVSKGVPFILFTIEPLAFEPKCPVKKIV